MPTKKHTDLKTPYGVSDFRTIRNEGTLLAGRYRIVRQLGHGGMGGVWLAEDTQLDNRQFAIKMLPSILVSNKRAYNQLKAEALAVMRLVHPNIAQIRAFEENNGNPFLVMDYIDGQTLDDYLAECVDGFSTHRRRDVEEQVGGGRTPAAPVYGLPESEVIRILQPIAAALDYAHGEGVVHRDVKPANVMIRKDGHPFILDFGIAREIQEMMTRVTGKLSTGTMLYMSPEQLRGQSPKAVQDVYSFAAMVYECLKGEPPFSRGQIEYQILNEPPEPLAGASATGGSPVGKLRMENGELRIGGVPSRTGGSPVGVNGLAARSTSIAASVMAGLAKKPEDRPATCAAVLEGDLSTQRREEADAQSSGRGRSPSGLQGNDLDRIEHVERVERDSGRDGAPRPSQTNVPRHDHKGVQLWDGGPYWADANIGAEKPEDYGFYFWWGDTVGYKHVGEAWVASEGSSSDFEFAEGHTPTCGKSLSTLKSEGWIIGGEERKSLLGKLFGAKEDSVLAAKHDAAQVHWGGEWRMPTKQELKDLCHKCDWTWTTMNGANGYVVRGRGNYASFSIFLPCAGYGIGSSLGHAGSTGAYWASVPYSHYNDSEAWDIGFNSGSHAASYYYRYYGQSVRPVQGFTE